MHKHYPVSLSEDHRQQIEEMVYKGHASAHTQRRGRILLLADETRPTGPLSDARIAEVLDTCQATVERTRKAFVEKGINCVVRAKRAVGPIPRRLDARGEAQLVALCCQAPPEGQARWTLQLLADKLVELQVVESVGLETVRQTLLSNQLKPWQKKQWCLPPQGQRRLRVRHGGRAGGLSPTARPAPAPGVPG